MTASTIISSRAVAEYYCKRLLSLGSVPIGLDCETEGCNPKKESPIGRAQIKCWSIYHESIGSLFIPNFSISYLESFRPWLEHGLPQKVGHNLISYDLHCFANMGIRLRGILGDTLRLSKLGNNVSEGHSLKELMQKELKIEPLGEYKELFTRPASLRERECAIKLTWCMSPSNARIPKLVGGAMVGVSWAKREFIPLTRIPEDYSYLMDKLVEYSCLDSEATAKLYPILVAKPGMQRKAAVCGNASGPVPPDMATVLPRSGADGIQRSTSQCG